MQESNRQSETNSGFKGTWIRRPIQERQDLSDAHKIVLSMIITLSEEKPCFALNQYFAKSNGWDVRKAGRIITDLQKGGWVLVSAAGSQFRKLSPSGKTADLLAGRTVESTTHANLVGSTKEMKVGDDTKNALVTCAVSVVQSPKNALVTDTNLCYIYNTDSIIKNKDNIVDVSFSDEEDEGVRIIDTNIEALCKSIAADQGELQELEMIPIDFDDESQNIVKRIDKLRQNLGFKVSELKKLKDRRAIIDSNRKLSNQLQPAPRPEPIKEPESVKEPEPEKTWKDDAEFVAVWDKYRAMSKIRSVGAPAAAFNTWRKLKQADKDAITDKIPAFVRGHLETGSFPKDFKTFLNPKERHWEGDPPKAATHDPKKLRRAGIDPVTGRSFGKF